MTADHHEHHETDRLALHWSDVALALIAGMLLGWLIVSGITLVANFMAAG